MKSVMSIVSVLLFQLIILGYAQDYRLDSQNRYAPVPETNGFKMAGYWVWDGSVIKVDNTYHLFASRWSKKCQFPDDYFVESKIVHAIAPSPIGSYNFQRVLNQLSMRNQTTRRYISGRMEE